MKEKFDTSIQVVDIKEEAENTVNILYEVAPQTFYQRAVHKREWLANPLAEDTIYIIQYQNS